MNPELIMRKATAVDFANNNGKVLRGINMLRIGYNRLSSIRQALDIDPDDFADCVNYLIESGYIRIRNIDTKHEVELSAFPMDELEAKLTREGIQLLAGVIEDPCILV